MSNQTPQIDPTIAVPPGMPAMPAEMPTSLLIELITSAATTVTIGMAQGMEPSQIESLFQVPQGVSAVKLSEIKGELDTRVPPGGSRQVSAINLFKTP